MQWSLPKSAKETAPVLLLLLGGNVVTSVVGSRLAGAESVHMVTHFPTGNERTPSTQADSHVCAHVRVGAFCPSATDSGGRGCCCHVTTAAVSHC